MRTRHNRFLRVRLECGCEVKLNTCRYRVSKDVAACLYGQATRTGVWCHEHPGMGQPVEYLGTTR
jgi:hypothetical protein